MPPDFFQWILLYDLFSIEEGQEIGLLALMHPESDVREVVVSTFDFLLPSIRLSSLSLTRLKAMSHWYPPSYQEISHIGLKSKD